MNIIDPRILAADVVLTCGPSCSGKTHFAHTLEREGFRRISLDVLIWQRYGDDFARWPFERQQAVFRNAVEILFAEIEKAIAVGERVVVDAPLCKELPRHILADKIRALGIEPVLACLKTPADEIRRRLALRTGSGPDDQLIPEHRLANFLRDFQPPTPAEHPVIILP